MNEVVHPMDVINDLLQALASTRRECDDALRELERERESRPKPGLWLVEERTSGWSGRWIAVGDLPDPLPVAQLERHRDAMQQAVAEAFDVSWQVNERGDRHRLLPSAATVVDTIIAAVAAEMGGAA